MFAPKFLNTSKEALPEYHYDKLSSLYHRSCMRSKRFSCFYIMTPPDHKWPLTYTKNNRVLPFTMGYSPTKYDDDTSFPFSVIVHTNFCYTHTHTHIHTYSQVDCIGSLLAIPWLIASGRLNPTGGQGLSGALYSISQASEWQGRRWRAWWWWCARWVRVSRWVLS